MSADYLDFEALAAIVGTDDARQLLRHAYLTGHGGRPLLERSHAEELLEDLASGDLDDGEGVDL